MFATILHLDNLWGDVKVYRDHCYLTTERAGIGIQVIDLSDIDNHNVTLVRTLPDISDAHNLAIDTESGYLYTLITAGGTGTTMCFDLTNPSNPVRVGANSMTGGQGMHDAQIVTYTSGPYAGRQILFGASGGNALRIWDVTNKAAPFQISSGTYPDVEYCHQCWLSEDRKYLYVDDELDESRNGTTTRTLVFDVSDINNPTLVSTFTTGLNSIDHNLYVKSGFIFESNYSSGLRIFDANDDPENPTEVGWYDTYLANDNANFNGTWSNFPFFPSGTVILSDRQTGLYIFDVSAATVKTTNVAAFRIVRGFHMNGGLPDLETIDNSTLTVKAGITLNNREAPINVEFTSTALWQHASRMNVSLTGFASTVGLMRTLELYDWVADAYVPVDISAPATSPQSVTVNVSDPDRFIQDGTRLMKARVSVKQFGITVHWPWRYSFDQFSWQINP